jgi:hypothetical protein
VFGHGRPVSVEGEGFDPGEDTFTSQDVENAFTDSLAMGVDSVSPSQWSWEGFTIADEPHEALAAVAELGRAWNDVKLRRTPGAVAPLRYRIDGRTRVVFGRPRPFSGIYSNKMLHGEIPVHFEFQPADTLHYGDEVQTFDVAGTPTTTPGFTFPLAFPFTSQGDSEGSAAFPPFGGDAPAPFTATFAGGTNPRLTGDGWEIQLDTTLLEGESITVSTYPWGVRALRNDGAHVGGLLSMRTRLTRARLDPAGGPVQFSAIDSSGTASCTIAWRPAYTTI